MTSIELETKKNDRISNSLITLIIPSYNEQDRIESTLASLEPLTSSLDMEIIVVCDGCQDDTARIARKWSEKLPLEVIEYDENMGKGYALRKGVMLHPAM